MNKEKKRFKYENNLKYRERVDKKIRRRTDKQYDKKIKKLQFEEKSLSDARIKVIKRMQEARWKPLFKNRLVANYVEGKVRVNGTDYLFENIGRTKLITSISNSTVTSGRVKTKFKPSIGGALAGGSMYGIAGAAAGGVLFGKEKTRDTRRTDTVTNCTYVGVEVIMYGKPVNICVYNGATSVESKTYSEAVVKAQVIMSQLSALAATPVPKSYLRVDEEPDVVALDKVIKAKHMEWRKIMDEPRVYPEPFSTDN